MLEIHMAVLQLGTHDHVSYSNNVELLIRSGLPWMKLPVLAQNRNVLRIFMSINNILNDHKQQMWSVGTN